MRNPEPTISPYLAMNYGAVATFDPNFNASYPLRTLKRLKKLGITKIRFGGTSPLYLDTQPEKAATVAECLLAKQMGFYIERGCTNLAGVDPKFTTSNWQTYHDYALDLAQQYYAVGCDAFMVANEQTGNNVDGTTIVFSDQLYTLLLQLAADIHAVCPNMKIVYNGRAYGGTAGEWDNWNTYIGIHGALPAYFQLGFNIYGGASFDSTIFQSQVNSVKAIGGYISEWNLSPSGLYGYNFDRNPYDEELQYRVFKDRMAMIHAAQIQGFFWTFHYWNINGGEYNFWSMIQNNGTSNFADHTEDKRPSYFALFPDTKDDGKKVALFLDGNTCYLDTGIVPDPNGICIGFWHKRAQYLTSNAEHVISNVYPGDNYANGFRLYHDQNSKNLVFTTKTGSVQGSFNVVNFYGRGVWNHIAILISSAGAFLLINGKYAGAFGSAGIQGNIGTPTRSIVFGARATDFAVKGQEYIDRLTIQNAPVTPWTLKQVRDLMRYDEKPAGALSFDFNHNLRDRTDTVAMTGGGVISYTMNVPKIRIKSTT